MARVSAGEERDMGRGVVGYRGQLTGTFFCEMTTAQLFPLMPMDVMFAAVIALNAYS